jgi:hypothetical protein
MTDLHNYHIPKEGEKNWHRLLNDNFKQIDNDIEIRDIDSNLANYQPIDGSKFLATDTGNIYFGDGQDWKALKQTQLHHSTEQGVPQSLFASLCKGKAVAVSSANGVRSVDPTSFETDDDALQALVDWAETSTNGVKIFSPHLRPDGRPYTITSTVSTSDDSDVSVSWQFFKLGNPQPETNVRMETTITDGSPMFRISGNIQSQQSTGTDAQHVATFEDLSASLDGNNAGVVEFAHGGEYIRNLSVRDAGGTVIQLTGRCFNGRINGLDISGSSSSAVAVSMRSGTTGRGTDWIIGPHITCVGEFDSIITDNGSSWSRVVVGGYYEGATGRSAIDFTGTGVMSVTPWTYVVFNNKEGNTDGIYLDTGRATLCPWLVENNGGHGIHLGPNRPQARIGPNMYTNYNGGHAIMVESVQAGNNKTTVPHPRSVVGSVQYLDPPWHNLYYNDGSQLINEGTSIVPSGDRTVATHYAGNPNRPLDVRWEVTPNSDDGTLVAQRQAHYSRSEQAAVVFAELSGAGDAEVEWRVLRY